jgi:tryptophan synthase beta chain
MRRPRVLVVDYEPAIRRALRVFLSEQSYLVQAVASGEEAVAAVEQQRPDLILLNLGMPGIGGLEAAKRIRSRWQTPIIVLSMMGEERDKVQALDAGADDYLTKPFGMQDLLARMRVALRHNVGLASGAEPVYRSGDLAIDIGRRVVSLAAEEIHLTPTEYDVLRYLATNAGRVVTHAMVLRAVWGPEYGEETNCCATRCCNYARSSATIRSVRATSSLTQASAIASAPMASEAAAFGYHRRGTAAAGARRRAREGAMEPTSDTKILLPESEIPQTWYNIVADLPTPPAPPLHPGTHQPIGPEALAPLFPLELIKQEVSGERYIEIPDEVREIYKLWRPSPLVRATRLERALETPARIYFKYEGVSPSGSHKSNTAVAQAYYNKEAGIKRIATETGAGQWGSALALACSMFGIDLKVYMVKISYEQKPYRRSMMQLWGADVVASPSHDTHAGSSVLEADPDSQGSLGIAISEAVEDAATREDTKYSLGSVLNHVLLHQTVIGQEALKQFAIAGDYPDIVIGCVGGGSNFAGLAFPFLREKLSGARETRFLAVEPESCPSLTRGHYAYDFGDSAMLTPLLKMYTLGSSFMPPGIHAGGLRYHAMSPLISQIYNEGLIEARAYHQIACFQAAVQFARTQGIVPAPESSHAIRAAIDEALRCKETGEAKAILFNLSGHGHFDMSAYDRYFQGDLEDYAYPAELVEAAMKGVPAV